MRGQPQAAACTRRCHCRGERDVRGRIALPAEWDHAFPFDAHGHAWAMRANRCGLIDRQGREVIPVAHNGVSVSAAGYSSILDRHPWLNHPWLLAAARALRVDETPLVVVYDGAARPVWRSDLHALRPLLMPSAAFMATLALLCGWRWRTARNHTPAGSASAGRSR